MPNRPPPPPFRPGAPAKAAPRHDPERLAKALRDNLLKRKSQARARTESEETANSTKGDSTK